MELPVRAAAAAVLDVALVIDTTGSMGDDLDWLQAELASILACFLVTRLDGLIVRTVESLVTGVRAEPADDEAPRRVGDYDRGVCRTDGQ